MSARNTIEVLMKRVVHASDGCWLWTGAKHSKGYGKSKMHGIRSRFAHRIFYESLVGPVPDGLELDHLCRVRHCVNPTHLEVVTGQINGLRGVGIQAKWAARTHCECGTPLTPQNGRRECVTCRRRRTREWMRRRRAVSA